MNTKKKAEGVVYSTNPDYKYTFHGDEQQSSLPNEKQDLRIWLERNHRGGKQVCVVKGFIGTDGELSELARKLKNTCGTGGSAKDGEIIIQGDHRDRILQFLLKEGYRAKKAGA